MGLFLIAAMARDGALGVTRDGKPGLPWPNLVHDQAWFRSLTLSGKPLVLARQWCNGEPSSPYGHDGPQNAVVMGRRTRESLPGPLVGREMIIIAPSIIHEQSDDWVQPAADTWVETFEDSLLWAENFASPHTFVIGGPRLFAEALLRPELEALFLTEVDEFYGQADTWFPATQAGYDDGFFWDQGIYQAMNGDTWQRYVVSPWIEDPACPRYRFGIWRRACSTP